ncbi:hypothetical protein PhCBS80983_g02902 [Powellomyces hirtus]|uniref:Indoleamine 2,3-dioxygenase n=1 Tax=Powellomyces hirtus TaxID=109895 RepID=A0A507E4M0_9FUNG|nr:hypothetical protein PhCBS80983_g02902 [Powellomyces hirtus]
MHLPRTLPLSLPTFSRRTLATHLPSGGPLGTHASFPVSATPSEFTITPRNGFLPLHDPLTTLPPRYAALESLLTRMPLTRMDTHQPGLLATGDFGPAVKDELPLYDVSSETDPRVLTALFRDYTFAASAYLLEPCDLHNRQRGQVAGGGDGTYGLGRSVLPKNLAVPMVQVAAKLGAKPFMEYAQSYALYNYARVDAGKGLEYDNLKLIRAFSGMESEHGFILVHVAMVAHTGAQVAATVNALNAAAAHDRAAFNTHLIAMRTALQHINAQMETMWRHSSPADYLKFRTFIMGTKNQPMFPRGVVYEGVSDQPTFYRGESGANDSIVPTLDNFLAVTENMPENALTEILRDFRSYRPENHTLWLQWVEERAKTLGVRQFALADPNSAVLYLSLLDQLREFRARHWNFTKQYILKHTRHPTATGGSPIVTWLPNQLSVVLSAMTQTATAIGNNTTSSASPLTTENRHLAQELLENAATQQRILDREVRELKLRFEHQDEADTDWSRAEVAAQA